MFPARYALPALLIVLLATRWGHFGTALSLPDASLAVFLLGGLWLGHWAFFAGLMVAAFGVDLALARSATEAGWCLTPAYWGLVPTYGVLWLAGRWLAVGERAREAGLYTLVSAAAVSVAFVLSNVSFWAYSGHFADMGALEYAFAVARYYPPYLGGAALYLALGWVVHQMLAARRVRLA